jgi:hypothetical protein
MLERLQGWQQACTACWSACMQVLSHLHTICQDGSGNESFSPSLQHLTVTMTNQPAAVLLTARYQHLSSHVRGLHPTSVSWLGCTRSASGQLLSTATMSINRPTRTLSASRTSFECLPPCSKPPEAAHSSCAPSCLRALFMADISTSSAKVPARSETRNALRSRWLVATERTKVLSCTALTCTWHCDQKRILHEMHSLLCSLLRDAR